MTEQSDYASPTQFR